MNSAEIRSSALSGVGPSWRGQSLLPAIDHVSILERACSPVLLTNSEPEIFDVQALIFTICAPWESVFAAAHAPGAGGFLEFDDAQWRIGVSQWSRALEKPITLEEIASIKAGISLIRAQLHSSRWRTIETSTARAPDEPGNGQAPSLVRGMRRIWPGLLLGAVGFICGVASLLLRVFN